MSELERYQVLMAVISGRGPAYLRGVNLTYIDLSGAGWLAEADLRGADLESANLKRANLRGANLESANLCSANLSGANLSEACLTGVKANVSNLSMAILRGADLKKASLIGACLIKADLEGADLGGADLEGANLEGANLRRARITNVNLKMTNLDGADLTEALIEGCSAPPPIKEDGGEDFNGAITAVRLADLLQLGCLARSDMKIEVYSKDNIRGAIHVGSGKVLHASTNGLEGEEALMKILGWEKGRFTAYPSRPPAQVTIEKPVEHLVLEWRRMQDEKYFPGLDHSPLFAERLATA